MKRAISELSEEELAFVAECLPFFGYDVGRLSEHTNVRKKELVAYLAQRERKAHAEEARGAEGIDLQNPQNPISRRPYPPAELLDEDDPRPVFLPAPDVWEWAQRSFHDPCSALYNPDHDHLEDANIGILWTNVGQIKGGRRVVGMCALPRIQGNAWQKALYEFQLAEWFGELPLDFLITLDAVYCSTVPNATWCALLEHELYHAAQALDAFGSPAFRDDGRPRYRIVSHDAEEFVGVVRRYGVGAAAGGVKDLVAAANRPPEIEAAEIGVCCGTCG